MSVLFRRLRERETQEIGCVHWSIWIGRIALPQACAINHATRWARRYCLFGSSGFYTVQIRDCRRGHTFLLSTQPDLFCLLRNQSPTDESRFRIRKANLSRLRPRASGRYSGWFKLWTAMELHTFSSENVACRPLKFTNPETPLVL